MQHLIDRLAYPPTHTYTLAPFEPTGVLRQRMERFVEVAPQFWTPANGAHLLDVGCNKGFFSLLGAERFYQVVGIDTAPGFTDLCARLVPTGDFYPVGFRDFVPDRLFDRVLILNGHHHLFREACGWGWVRKLAACTRPGALVLVEGIPNGHDPDGAEFGDLHENEFVDAMEEFFSCGAEGPSADYTPGRKIWLFERRRCGLGTAWGHPPIDDSVVDIRFAELALGGSVGRLWHKSNVVVSGNDCYKIYARPLDPAELMRISIASDMPGATPIARWVAYGRDTVGWVEPFLGGNHPDEKTALGMLCNNQIELARIGYADTDFAVINCIGAKIVDKNGVFPILDLPDGRVNYVDGSLAISLRCFSMVTEAQIFRACGALASRDSCETERVFMELGKEWSK